MDFFRLKPIRVARVSEVSETTAASQVPKEERIDFHIGNPLQDPRLSSAFLRIALGIEVHHEELHETALDAIQEYLHWEASDKPKLEFILRILQKSSPYMPRGGYLRTEPHPLIKTFFNWLDHQQDPLHYDGGEQSGRREIILASGGIQEALRILLLALSSYLEITPARVLCYQFESQRSWKTIPNLLFEELSTDERLACEQVEQFLIHPAEIPTFLLIGSPLGEETRRKLRQLSLKYPLSFIEANNAPNHLSLAREAKLMQRVIRFLSPAIFAQRLHSLATVFIVGNADFLSIIENVHFNFKGTPSASEVELLSFLLEQKLTGIPNDVPREVPQVKPAFDGLALGIATETLLPQIAERAERQLDRLLGEHARLIEHSLTSFEARTNALDQRVQNAWKREIISDEFSGIDPRTLLDLLVQNLHEPAWRQTLQRSFLSAFVKHQPQYQLEACQITSGSSRTALGILGFHCGIREVVIADLSWTYEQCFPIVHAVPLKESLELDAEAMIAKVEELRYRDPSWSERGAVVINNPHNGTGRVFQEDAIRKVVAYCLQHNLYLIDDLAYQNVEPRNALPEIKTVRQLSAELVRLGGVNQTWSDRVITVHSMSKTDCLAGARLAVVEIRDPMLRDRFDEVNSQIQPNLAAIFVCYLFYRNTVESGRAYWQLRNAIFQERTQALMSAAENLPPERNPFDITIIPPAGSMYPLLRVGRLPAGLSLDWLASSLARGGIGLLPLATFARTEKGYETGRKTFRLTLGGVDNAETLLAKTRRLLIALNRLMAEEESHYNRKPLPIRDPGPAKDRSSALRSAWSSVAEQILERARDQRLIRRATRLPRSDDESLRRDFLEGYISERLEVFRIRLLDRALISDESIRQALSDGGTRLSERLEREFMKDSLQRRQEQFRLRPYDRTVHPTQMYSLRAELALDEIVRAIIAQEPIGAALTEKVAQELWQEYLGRNVAISSREEADEILLDLSVQIAAEEHAELFTNIALSPFLSFWSDWDGSNRPSGQGHRLVAAVVMENVQRLSRIINLLMQADPHVNIKPDLRSELQALPQQHQRFTRLLNDITFLTHQLEQRYRGILPFPADTTPVQRLATRWHLRRDRARILLQHNDRYERRMIELRHERRAMLEYYFSLNKKLRKQLHALIPDILANRESESLLREVVGYRDILQRVVITPRIDQRMITARDSFAIDTTVYNMYELNAIAGEYGNPGLVLGIQLSLSTRPEALISLDRKMRIQREQTLRAHPASELPAIWIIPLFEDIDAVKHIRVYLDRVWDYATQSRQTAQSPQDRFAEILAEVFIAGSDLSQQVSQATAAFLYLKAKYDIQSWLAEHNLSDVVRVKLGSGEPMQRQGGYYSRVAGRPAFLHREESQRRFANHLPAAARRSTAYAVTPLQGVYLGGDLRTFQSNLAEQLRFLPVGELVSLLYHVHGAQQDHRRDLIRATESIAESRLGAQRSSMQELERLTTGTSEALYEEFLKELTDNFRHILYGRDEDVVGIHIISYFIGRSIPPLRDRPTSRPMPRTGTERGQQILAGIAEIIPLAQQGSLLRAIAHNQAQTVVLGINQLTTGLFRALERFGQKAFADAERERMMAERLLPQLPVYEILSSLRIYQDSKGQFLKRIDTALPAGNSALGALREDSDARERYLPLFQQELLRRHGVNVSDFLEEGVFLPDLLPTLRPDLAVLLQKDLFNTDLNVLLEGVSGRIADPWRAEITELLRLPEKIQRWRAIIWEAMGDSIYQRVQGFTELATSLYAFSSTRSFGPSPAVGRGRRPSARLTDFLRTSRADDEMRSFLLGAIDYLSSFAEENIEVPVSIIRAMNDVERLAQIEEGALPPVKQDAIRFALLQIARLAAENG